MTLHFCARSRATVPGDEHACACTRAAPAAASLVPSATAPAVGGGGGGGVQDRRTHQQNHSSHRAFGKSPQRCWQKGVWTQHSARLYPSYDESFKNMAARGFVLLSFCFSGHLGESLLPVDPGG